MAAAYGVPLGGALFALEVLRGMLAWRLVLPALLTSVVASATSWLVLPNAPSYELPHFDGSFANLALAVLVGPIAGLVSVLFVRVIALADRYRPKSRWRLVAPVLVLGLLGLVSIPCPPLLGNGKDIAQLAFADQILFALLLALLLLKPAATVLCLGSGVPGGLFTPSLALGALLGGVLGHAYSWLWPENAARTGCRGGRGGRSGGNHTRTDLGSCADHGADRPGPVVCCAAAARSRDRDTGIEDDRTTLHL